MISFNRKRWCSFYGLFLKELRRFTNTYNQTIIAPVVNGLLLLTIFSVSKCCHTASQWDSLSAAPGFLASGILGMAIIQNSFANTSGSIVSSKVMGYVGDFVIPPFASNLFVLAMVLAACVRAFVIAAVFCIATLAFGKLQIHNLFTVMILIGLISFFSGLMGLIVGFYTNSFEQMSAVTNYVMLPPLLLSGVFFSIRDVPLLWKKFMAFNPFFYMIDGLRYGFIGVSECRVGVSIIILSLSVYLCYIVCAYLFRSGVLIKR